MSTHAGKTALAISALIGASGYALAQMSSGGPAGAIGQTSQRAPMEQMHQGMMQGQGSMHGEIVQGRQFTATTTPTLPGQDAFGAIQEVVHILESDSNTDWSKVNIEALRQHLIDMNEVTLHAVASQRDLGDGIEITVTGQGRTRDAIKRMLPEHVRELKEIGWDARSDELPDGIKLTVYASEAHPLTKLEALGFMGIMVQGSHHQLHHLLMARGQLSH